MKDEAKKEETEGRWKFKWSLRMVSREMRLKVIVLKIRNERLWTPVYEEKEDLKLK